MSKRYMGRIVLDVNGVEVDVESVKPSHDMKTQAVDSMNSTGRKKGKVDGVPEFKISVTIPIPRNDTIDWENIEDAVITVYDKRTGGIKVQWLDVFTHTVGEDYGMEGAAKRDIEMEALDFRRF